MKIVTFGCRINTYESELIKQWEPDLGDVIVVNTCAVTSEAERQCKQTIRRLHKENPNVPLIVTGCAVQLNPDVYEKMPEVSRILGNIEKTNKKAYLSCEKRLVGSVKDKMFEIPLVTNYENRVKAFIQIQQGCDHQCTFCIVNQVRGKNKGLIPEIIIKEIQSLVDKGFSEIVLTGIDVTSYPYGFSGLVERVLFEVRGLKRLRLGSLDPKGVDNQLIDLWKRFECLMPHVHLSIQSGNDEILKKMGRRHRQHDVITLVEKLRQVRSDFVFGGDFITGFPTENDNMFKDTLDLVQQANIILLHVFPFSVRPQTASAKMDMVPVFVRKRRAKELRILGEKLKQNYMYQQLGIKDEVLIETGKIGFNQHYIKTKVDKLYPAGTIVMVQNKEIKNGEFLGQT